MSRLRALALTPSGNGIIPPMTCAWPPPNSRSTYTGLCNYTLRLSTYRSMVVGNYFGIPFREKSPYPWLGIRTIGWGWAGGGLYIYVSFFLSKHFFSFPKPCKLSLSPPPPLWTNLMCGENILFIWWKGIDSAALLFIESTRATCVPSIITYVPLYLHSILYKSLLIWILWIQKSMSVIQMCMMCRGLFGFRLGLLDFLLSVSSPFCLYFLFLAHDTPWRTKVGSGNVVSSQNLRRWPWFQVSDDKGWHDAWREEESINVLIIITDLAQSDLQLIRAMGNPPLVNYMKSTHGSVPYIQSTPIARLWSQ